MFGSKSAERDAKNAEATQYYNELKRISLAPRLTTIDDPEITGADKYNAEVQKYNARLDEFARQLSGQVIYEKIQPIHQEYVGRVAQALATSTQQSANPMSGMNMGSVFNSINQKPAQVDYIQLASKLMDNQQVSGLIPNYQAQRLVAEYRQKADKYMPVAAYRDSTARLQGMYNEYAGLVASVTQVDKTLGISSQMEQKQARLTFEASASGKVLAGQRRAAGKMGKASTILTKGV